MNPVSLVPEMAPYTILVDGISKAFAATGLRVGFAFGPPAIIARMSDILGHVGAWAPRPEQVATAGVPERRRRAWKRFRRAFHEGIKLRLGSLHRGFRLLEKRGLPVRVMEPMGAIYLTVQFPAAGKKTPDGKVLADQRRRPQVPARARGVRRRPVPVVRVPGR